jgi:hypothetical protein
MILPVPAGVWKRLDGRREGFKGLCRQSRKGRTAESVRSGNRKIGRAYTGTAREHFLSTP